MRPELKLNSLIVTLVPSSLQSHVSSAKSNSCFVSNSSKRFNRTAPIVNKFDVARERDPRDTKFHPCIRRKDRKKKKDSKRCTECTRAMVCTVASNFLSRMHVPN